MTGQLDLTFNAPPPHEGVGDDVRDDALGEMRGARAEPLPCELRFAAEDWRHPQWESRVWSGPRTMEQLEHQGLAEYAANSRFDALVLCPGAEPIGDRTLRRYAGQLPSDFSVVLKAPRLVTAPRLRRASGFDVAHVRTNKHFLDPDWFSAEVAGPALAALGDRLSWILLSFPADMNAAGISPDGFAFRLQTFLRRLSSPVPLAVEIREGNFLSLEYARVLATAGIAHVYSTAPDMPPFAEQTRWVPTAPYRLVRIADPVAPQYPSESIRRRALTELLTSDPALPALVMINEDSEGSIPESVDQIVRKLAVE